MAKYRYPCIFNWDKDDKVWLATFPDWEEEMGGMTHGRTWAQAKIMAKDLLNLMCLTAEEDDMEIPTASASVSLADKESVCRFVEADTEVYAKAIEQFKRFGRFRMREQASWRYLYRRGPQTPADDTEETI